MEAANNQNVDIYTVEQVKSIICKLFSLENGMEVDNQPLEQKSARSQQWKSHRSGNAREHLSSIRVYQMRVYFVIYSHIDSNNTCKYLAHIYTNVCE